MLEAIGIISPFFLDVKTLDDLILWGGYGILFLIVFAETGLFVGFLLPGDSLLITAGLIAATGKLSFTGVCAVMITASILGDITGYFIGKHLGKPLFEKQNTLFFRQDYLLRTQAFYEKHGGKTIFFARFVPVIRSFATTVAGIASMPFPVFIFFSVSGAICWILFFTSLGYYLGASFPQLVECLNLIILVIVGLIVISTIVRVIRLRNQS
ncbi:MAG: VTT domain-containing protein [Chloroherpetonaceae bacterium]|nr:VTT domain-containing protein [Chloroherpetonaceae bacterium]